MQHAGGSENLHLDICPGLDVFGPLALNICNRVKGGAFPRTTTDSTSQRHWQARANWCKPHRRKLRKAPNFCHRWQEKALERLHSPAMEQRIQLTWQEAWIMCTQNVRKSSVTCPHKETMGTVWVKPNSSDILWLWRSAAPNPGVDRSRQRSSVGEYWRGGTTFAMSLLPIWLFEWRRWPTHSCHWRQSRPSHWRPIRFVQRWRLAWWQRPIHSEWARPAPRRCSVEKMSSDQVKYCFRTENSAKTLGKIWKRT